MSIHEITRANTSLEKQYQLAFVGIGSKGPSSSSPPGGTPSVSPSMSPILDNVVQIHLDRLTNLCDGVVRNSIIVQRFFEEKITSVFEACITTQKSARIYIPQRPSGYLKCRYTPDKKIELVFKQVATSLGNKSGYNLVFLTDTLPKQMGYEFFYEKPLPGKNLGETQALKLIFQQEARLTQILSGKIPYAFQITNVFKYKNLMELKGMYSPAYQETLLKISDYLPFSMPARERLCYITPLFLQITRALEVLHSLDPHLIHGDLNPATILISKREEGGQKTLTASLKNFGQAKVSGTLLNGRLAPLGYVAPEQFNQTWVLRPSSDIWSLGMIIIFGVLGEDLESLFTSSVQCHPELQMRRDQSIQFKIDILRKIEKIDSLHHFYPIIQQMLASSPEERPSANSVKKNLEIILKLLLKR